MVFSTKSTKDAKKKPVTQTVDRQAGVNLAGIHEPRKSLDPGFEHTGAADETGSFFALSMKIHSMYYSVLFVPFVEKYS
ncbi:MAG: hypothetical protein JW748_07110 [Anaerolineales bacterium]|nr:hypothetical protein [Anaerolineales bacterium]